MNNMSALTVEYKKSTSEMLQYESTTNLSWESNRTKKMLFRSLFDIVAFIHSMLKDKKNELKSV